MLRDVNADVPKRIPPGTWAEASPGGRRFLGSSVSRDGRHGKIRELTVNGDAHEIADLLDFAASQAERAQVQRTRWLSFRQFGGL